MTFFFDFSFPPFLLFFFLSSTSFETYKLYITILRSGQCCRVPSLPPRKPTCVREPSWVPRPEPPSVLCQARPPWRWGPRLVGFLGKA